MLSDGGREGTPFLPPREARAIELPSPHTILTEQEL